MTSDERMKIREALLYIADCMVAVNDMHSQHNCNDCGLKLRCAYVPHPGQPVLRAEGGIACTTGSRP